MHRFPYARTATAALGLLTGMTLVAASPADARPVRCGRNANVIVSNELGIQGTECRDIIYPGPDTRTVEALGGNDLVVVTDGDLDLESAPWFTIHVDLGTGDDSYYGIKDSSARVKGGSGNDFLRSFPEPATPFGFSSGSLAGGIGDDTIVIGDQSAGLGEGGNDRLEVRGTPACISDYSLAADGDLADPDLYCAFLSGGSGHDVLDTRKMTSSGRRAFASYLHGGTGWDKFLTAQPGTPLKDEIRERKFAGLDAADVDHTDVTQQPNDTANVEFVQILF